eukprot:GCRY01002318.1.p1 GENE.GCRY01002318.1~~GCRY01002318.1.p1  ORF type:complete len:677 (+),score=146.03 GCRY01002318.1:317-2347(+)
MEDEYIDDEEFFAIERAIQEAEELSKRRCIGSSATDQVAVPISHNAPQPISPTPSSHCISPKVLNPSASSSSLRQNLSIRSPMQVSSMINSNTIPSASRPKPLPFHIDFSLSAPCRIKADCTYNPQVVEVFKTIPSKRFEGKIKCWTFHVEDFVRLEQALQQCPAIQFSHTAPPMSAIRFICDTWRREPHVQGKHEEIMEKYLPSAFLQTLFPFQKEGICFGLARHGCCIVGDEMGLGKTLQGLGVAACYPHEWPLLVVCPSSLRLAWRDAVRKWLPEVEEGDVHVIFTLKEVAEVTAPRSSKSVWIISYDLLGRASLPPNTFKVVVCDECHYIKNFKAKRTKSVLHIIKGARRRILLSGTVALSRPVELFTQISAVIPSLFTGFLPFATRYCGPHQTAFGTTYNGSTHAPELAHILSHFLIRRFKSGVLSQLPPKIRQTVRLAHKGSREFFRQVQQFDPNSIDLSSSSSSLAVPAGRGGKNFAELYQETGKLKVSGVLDFLEETCSGTGKSIVFAHHQSVIESLAQGIQQRKLGGFIRIEGSTPPGDRHRLIHDFNTNASFQIALLSILAANAGVTLTAASRVIFAELYFVPGILKQCEDRAHRIGQKDTVNVVYLLLEGGLDDRIWPMVERKLQVLSELGVSEKENMDVVHNSVRTLPSSSLPHNQTLLDGFFS